MTPRSRRRAHRRPVGLRSYRSIPYIFPILTGETNLQYIFQYLESCEPILSTSPLRTSEILRFKVLTTQNMEKIARCACHGGWALAQNPGFRLRQPKNRRSCQNDALNICLFGPQRKIFQYMFQYLERSSPISNINTYRVPKQYFCSSLRTARRPRSAVAPAVGCGPGRLCRAGVRRAPSTVSSVV